MKTVAWFSAGVSSAVAIKLAIKEIDEIYYIHIDDQHSDTLRFIKDCQGWFEKPVKIMQSPYKSVFNACTMTGGKGYINGIHGARCTEYLKKKLRIKWEYEQDYEIKLRYVWGMDFNEQDRAEGIKKVMSEKMHLFPLIDRNMGKNQAHEILKASGIKRPMMYDLGYHNNNCVGCVKGGMGYWNKIRVDFPDVFKQRSELERTIGASCINGVYLDELDPNRGRDEGPIVDDCGIFCELIALR